MTADDRNVEDRDRPAALVARIVSGGQTGVDRAALDVAIAMEISHGGWCPRGRLAEDGAIPPRYQLQETPSAEYPVRTEQNVVDSCATLILYRDRLHGGTRLTHTLARRHGRPVLRVDLNQPRPVIEVRDWMRAHHIRTLNVAGPRESSAPGIAAEAERYLRELLAGGNLG